MRPATFKRVMGRYPQRSPYATLVSPPVLPELPRAAMYHYWHPDRDGAERCPEWFNARLVAIHPDLAMTRPPLRAPTPSHPWLAWYRKPAITSPICPGWLLLFCWQTEDKTPLPLDDRVFANLYRISALQFGSASAYFDSIVQTLKADRQRAEDQDHANTSAKRREMLQSHKIKNIGRGSKFALHHDGSVVPSRGEANWARERELQSLPSEMAATLRDRRKRLHSLERLRRRGRG